MIDILNHLQKILKIVMNIENHYIQELKKRDLIIKAQKQYIKDLEELVDSV
jgi:hypothetical protein